MMLEVCCGTTDLRYDTLKREFRTGEWKESRKVYHVRGTDRFWHWEDQIDRLAPGYGRTTSSTS